MISDIMSHDSSRLVCSINDSALENRPQLEIFLGSVGLSRLFGLFSNILTSSNLIDGPNQSIKPSKSHASVDNLLVTYFSFAQAPSYAGKQPQERDIFFPKMFIKESFLSKYMCLHVTNERRSDHQSCTTSTLNLHPPDSNLEHGTLSQINLFPHNFVSLTHKKKKISASTLPNHDRNYALRSALVSWPDNVTQFHASKFL